MKNNDEKLQALENMYKDAYRELKSSNSLNRYYLKNNDNEFKILRKMFDDMSWIVFNAECGGK